MPNDEHEVQEGMELDCLAVASAIGLVTGPQADVEAQLEQVGDVVDLGVGGGYCRDQNGVNNSRGGGFYLPDWVILDPVGLELRGETLVNTGVNL